LTAGKNKEESTKMKICRSNSHGEIVFDFDACSACEAIKAERVDTSAILRERNRAWDSIERLKEKLAESKRLSRVTKKQARRKDDVVAS
jgi:hypothetical protein